MYAKYIAESYFECFRMPPGLIICERAGPPVVRKRDTGANQEREREIECMVGIDSKYFIFLSREKSRKSGANCLKEGET